MNEHTKIRCCFCDYTSNARGVAAHMGKEHKREIEMRKRIVGLGRLPEEACPRCKMVHERFSRVGNGWMADRRKLERSGKIVKSAFAFGRFPPGYKGRGEKVRLATLTPPKGTNRIIGVMFFSEIPGQFHITASGREYTFDVDQGIVGAIHVRKVA